METKSGSTRWRGLAGFGLAMLLLSGCSGDAGKILGLEKEAPDEFAVVSRAPLSLPPDYGLRPPEPGAARPQEQTPRGVAEDVVLGDRPQGGAPAQGLNSPAQPVSLASRNRGAVLAGPNGNVIVHTPGDSAFLDDLDVDAALPDIRGILADENAILALEDEELIDSLIFWKDKPPPGTIVDAEQERRRIQENSALGRPVTDGETPMIERKKRHGSILPF